MRRRLPRRRHLPRLALLAAVTLAPIGAPAAETDVWRSLADPVFRPVAPNADMPRALIPITMTEDASGFLWLAGDEALVRWDGYQFRDYPGQPSLPDGVHDTATSVLYRDSQKTFWAGTQSNGLARFDPAQDRLVCVPLATHTCGNEHVWSIADDGTGGLWVGTAHGLFHRRADGRGIDQFHAQPGEPGGLPSDTVLAVLRDQGGLWVGTDKGLLRSRDFGHAASSRSVSRSG